MIYKTAGEQVVSKATRPPEHGEWVNPHGYYLAGMRHAYIDGTQLTLCGIHLPRLPGMWSNLLWSDGGDYPPRCAACVALAI
jgi:hypothetical protein